MDSDPHGLMTVYCTEGPCGDPAGRSNSARALLRREQPLSAGQPSLRRLPAALFLIVLAAFAAYPNQASGSVEPLVRILLDEGRPKAAVTGDRLTVRCLEGGQWKDVVKDAGSVRFGAAGRAVRLDGPGLVSPSFTVTPARGFVVYDGRALRGSLVVTVRADGLTVVSRMPLESYLAGVINGEIDSSWPMDSVKAQAVASRSYALYRIRAVGGVYDLGAGFTGQVYAGADSEDERALEAVRGTRGQVLYRGGELVEAFFHSSCGGMTAGPSTVWGSVSSSKEGVACGYCQDAPFARWTLTLKPEEIAAAVRDLYPWAGTPRTMGVHRRGPDGRVQVLFVDTGRGRFLVDAGEFRKQLGYRRLPSTRFTLALAGDGIVLTGAGYGHGVGLCQWGARGSALDGMDYRQILEKYYPGTEVRRAY